MTKVLTVRIDADLLVKAEARATRLGLDRAKYVRSLIEDDLAGAKVVSPHTFASEDLAGMYEGTGRAATNTLTRQRLRNRAGARTSGR